MIEIERQSRNQDMNLNPLNIIVFGITAFAVVHLLIGVFH